MANDYRNALEALNSTGTRAAVRNKFNRLAAQSDDPSIRRMAGQIVEALESRQTNTARIPVCDMNGIPAAKDLANYCRQRAYA